MSQSDSSFSPEVVDHFLHPRNVGRVENPAAVVEIENEICGDRLELSASVAGTRIESIKFRSQGCAVAIAAASKLTEAVSGNKIVDAAALAETAIDSVQAGSHNEKPHCLDIVRRAWSELLQKLNAD